MIKKISIIVLLTILVFSLASCKNVETTTSTTDNPSTTTTTDNPSTTTSSNNPQIVMHISNGKDMYFELYPEIAPITVANFLKLIDDNYYEDIVFHRIIENFMIQAGGYKVEDYEDTGQKMLIQKLAKEKITGEFSANGIENNIKHVPGVLSMARANDYNSGSTQFFICVSESKHLDGNYAAFGMALDNESIENAIEISKIPTMSIVIGSTPFDDFPQEAIYITSIERIN